MDKDGYGVHPQGLHHPPGAGVFSSAPAQGVTAAGVGVGGGTNPLMERPDAVKMAAMAPSAVTSSQHQQPGEMTLRHLTSPAAAHPAHHLAHAHAHHVPYSINGLLGSGEGGALHGLHHGKYKTSIFVTQIATVLKSPSSFVLHMHPDVPCSM